MANGPYDAPEGFGAFLRSALSSATRELVGLEPSNDVALYRMNNPTGGFISNLAGAVTPGLGWAAAATKIPRMVNLLNKIGSAERMAANPFMTRAMVEVARFAPFEAGRLAGSVIAGGDTGEVFKEGIIGLAAAGGLGGILGKINAGSTPTVGKTDLGRISQVVPDFDPTAPAQLRTVALRKALTEQPQNAELFGRAIRANTEEALGQVPSGEAKTVFSIAGDKDATRAVRGLLNPRQKEEGLDVRKLNISPSGLENYSTQQDTLARAAIGDLDEFASSTLYPRVARANSIASANRIKNTFEMNFWNQADGWKYVWEEGGNKMAVLAKKIKGDPITAAKGDEWLVFKTAAPEKFITSVDFGAKGMQSIWNKVYPAIEAAQMDAAGQNSKLYQAIKTYDEIAGPEAAVKALATAGPETIDGIAGKIAQKLANTSMAKKLGSQVTDDVGRLGQITREYVVPTEFQAVNPRARAVFGMAKNARDAAQAQAHELFYGNTSRLTNGWKYIANVPRSGNIDAKIDAAYATKATEAQLRQALTRNIPIAEAEAMGMDPKVLDALRELRRVDDLTNAEIATAKLVSGAEGGFTPSKDHYLFTRTWPGEHRAEVLSGGQRVIILGGRTPQEAKMFAEEFSKELTERGIPANIGKQWTRSDRSHDLAEASKIVRDQRIARSVDEATEATLNKVYSPGFVKERKGGRGFIGDLSAIKKDELKEIIRGQIEDKMKFAAEMMFQARTAGQMQKLAAENPNLAAVMADRVNKVWGKAGPLTTAINATSDRVLAPYLGGNSATKIAQAVNSGMFHLSFGFGNVAFPVLNAMTTVITAPAEIALLQKGSAQTLLKYYNMLPVIGKDSLPRGQTGVMDVWKLMREGFRKMGNPEQGFMERLHRGALEGVTDPRFAEEFIGQNSKTALNLRGVLKGEQGLFKMILEASKLLPSASEKFARIWTFTIGDEVAQKVMGLSDPERIYQFARRFTERTMYNYAASDRALSMTGPIGSVFGLYKNWMMHYLGNWMVYAGEGMMKSQWAPLLWATATAWTAGGALGAGPASMLVDAAARLFSDKKTTQEAIYDWFGGRGIASDAALYGLPGLFGMSLATQGSAPGSEVIRDMGFLTNLAIWDRAKAAGKFIGNLAENMTAGVSPVHSQLIAENFYRAFAPRAMYRAASVLEDNNLRSMSTGTPLVKDMSMLHRILYSMGLNPVEVDNTLALGRSVWENNEKQKLTVEWLGRGWEEAQRAGDWNQMQKIMGMGIGMGLFDKVLHSVQSRNSREAKDVIQAVSKSPETQQRRENLGLR